MNRKKTHGNPSAKNFRGLVASWLVFAGVLAGGFAFVCALFVHFSAKHQDDNASETSSTAIKATINATADTNPSSLDPTAPEAATARASNPAESTLPEPNAATTDADSSPTLAPAGPLHREVPSLQDVRNEVQKNPHDTPPSLLRFSVVVAERMELAENSEPEARRLIDELGDCASGHSDRPLSAQAFCLLNAHRLSNRHASLEPQWKRIEAQASPRAMGLVRHLMR